MCYSIDRTKKDDLFFFCVYDKSNKSIFNRFGEQIAGPR